MSTSTADGRISSVNNKKFITANLHPTSYSPISKSDLAPNTSAYNSSSYSNKFLNAFEPASFKPSPNSQSGGQLSFPTSDLSISPSSNSPPPNDREADQVFYNPCNSAEAEHFFSHKNNNSSSNHLHDDSSGFENSLEYKETIYPYDSIHEESQSHSIQQQRYSHNSNYYGKSYPGYSTNIFINYEKPSKLTPTPAPRSSILSQNLYSQQAEKIPYDQKNADSVSSHLVDSSDKYNINTTSKDRTPREQNNYSCTYLGSDFNKEPPPVSRIKPSSCKDNDFREGEICLQRNMTPNSENTKRHDDDRLSYYTGRHTSSRNPRKINNAAQSTNMTGQLGTNGVAYRRFGGSPNHYNQLAASQRISRQVSWFLILVLKFLTTLYDLTRQVSGNSTRRCDYYYVLMILVA